MVPDSAWIEVIGYIAGAFMLTMAGMKTQRAMRLCHIAANVCFITYGLLVGALPVALINVIILVMHLRWFAQRLPIGLVRRSV